MRDARWTDVDGVPVVWAELPGPFRATLHFRVGVANETAPTHGITHLVEHLALHGMHGRPYPLNGAVELTRTVFAMAGQPEEAAEFLASVSTALGELPADRVTVERNVLRAEAARNATSYAGELLFQRYGAQAHGLAGMEEFGLRWIEAPMAQWWATQRFTKANAIAVLTGRPPRGLRLPLPDGPEQPVVDAVPVETETPAWSNVAAAGVAVAGVVSRTPALGVAIKVVADELNRVLRFERGLTYSVAGAYETLDSSLANVTFSADSDPSHHAEVRDALAGIVERLANDGIDTATLDRVRAERDRVDDEDRMFAHLDASARDFVLGRPRMTFRKRDAFDFTVDDVSTSLRELAASAIYLLPHGITMRYRTTGGWSTDTVDGRSFRSHSHPAALVVGPEGISIVQDGAPVTIRWSETSLAGWWQDGARAIVSRNGQQLTVVPADWQAGHMAVQMVDQFAPRQLVVPLGDSGPRPVWTPPQPNQRGRWRGAVLSIGALLSFLMLVAGTRGPRPATSTQAEITASDAKMTLVIGVVVGLMTLGFGLAMWLRRDPD